MNSNYNSARDINEMNIKEVSEQGPHRTARSIKDWQENNDTLKRQMRG